MDISKDLAKLKDLVGISAPILANVLGGPYYSIAVGILSKLLGADGSISDVFNKLSTDKDISIRLKQVEDQHCEILEKLASESFARESVDREDARKRQKDLHDFTPTVLALGFLFIFAGVLFFVLNNPSPANQSILDKLQAGLLYILAYFFGGVHSQIGNHHND